MKICGLTRSADARSAAKAGAEYLGVVVVPGTPRAVAPAAAREIGDGLGGSLVLVTADRDPERLAHEAEEAGAAVIQLHGDESPDGVVRLRERGSWKIWKTVRVRRPEDVERAVDRFAPVIDGFHLDGWHPEKIGGSGTRFSWESLRAVRASIPRSLTVVVAGGLTPENVRDAIVALDPDVVDVSSGVELRVGVKDPERVRAFVRQARGIRGSG